MRDDVEVIRKALRLCAGKAEDGSVHYRNCRAAQNYGVCTATTVCHSIRDALDAIERIATAPASEEQR